MRVDKQPYDIIIIGAGPAGCMAALHLPGDFKALVVDAAPSPEGKICGGLLNQKAWRFLERFENPERLLDSPGKLIFRYVNADRLIEKEIGLHLYSASKPKLNAWLLSMLPDRVEVWRETSFLGYRDYGKHVEVELKRGPERMTIISRYLIGADGARSLIRQRMNTGKDSYHIVLQDWLKPEKLLPPYFDCIFSNRVGPGFIYGYIIPKGRLAIVGSVFNSETRSISAMHELARNALCNKVGQLSWLARRESGVAFRLRSMEDILLGRGRILLVGEAAGIISPTSGEGISYALYSGEACGMAFWSGQDPLEQYSQLITPVLDDIQSKMGKLRLLEGRFSRVIANRMPVRVLSWLSKQL